MMTAFSEEVTDMFMSFAEAERAAREKLESANQKLVKDFLNLSMNFDSLARHSRRQKQEIESANRALETATKECESLKIRIKHTHESVKTNLFEKNRLVQVQLQWKDAPCKSMTRKEKRKYRGEAAVRGLLFIVVKM
jgi:chromosome segregation ATPase